MKQKQILVAEKKEVSFFRQDPTNSEVHFFFVIKNKTLLIKT